jgi:hypothetical protein
MIANMTTMAGNEWMKSGRSFDRSSHNRVIGRYEDIFEGHDVSHQDS